MAFLFFFSCPNKLDYFLFIIKVLEWLNGSLVLSAYTGFDSLGNFFILFLRKYLPFPMAVQKEFEENIDISFCFF